MLELELPASVQLEEVGWWRSGRTVAKEITRKEPSSARIEREDLGHLPMDFGEQLGADVG